MTDLSPKELETLLVCSFRYALGRPMYIVEEMCDLLIKHKDKLAPWVREQFIRDIESEYHRRSEIINLECWDRLKEELLK